MSIAATRESFPTKLYKNTRMLQRALAIESVTSADGAETFIAGRDYELSKDGSLDWIGDATHLGRDVLIIYHR
jgi:hypothetical protein